MYALDLIRSNAKFATAPAYSEENVSHPNARVDLLPIVVDGSNNNTCDRGYGHGQSMEPGAFPAARSDFVTGYHHFGKSAGIRS